MGYDKPVLEALEAAQELTELLWTASTRQLPDDCRSALISPGAGGLDQVIPRRPAS